MSYCQQCGVETDDNANFCSLCGAPISNENSIEPDEITAQIRERKALSSYQKLTRVQRWKIFWEIAGMIIIAGILISLTINLAGDHALTWSKFVIAVGLTLFVNITLISFLNRRIFLLFLLSFFTSAAFIAILDVILGISGIITSLGIPLLLAAYLIVLAFVLIERKTRQKGLNLIAYAILAMGILSICTDGIITIYSKGFLKVGWSLTVMVSAILIAALLLYVHHRLKRVTDLKRFFHI
ncbi:MAG: zinc ribbon domain-containing protein [Prolixibacteraceae bacterium]|nr:zinc ribbon domain-containing protein [Prolixibacteraceae bacterium]